MVRKWRNMYRLVAMEKVGTPEDPLKIDDWELIAGYSMLTQVHFDSLTGAGHEIKIDD